MVTGSLARPAPHSSAGRGLAEPARVGARWGRAGEDLAETVGYLVAAERARAGLSRPAWPGG